MKPISHEAKDDGAHAICQLNLPMAQLQLERDREGRITVYDRWRGRHIVLTPEEWVRQHFASMLVSHKGFPSGRIANEISIELNSTARRCDTVVYDDARRPLMIVEYKAPSVAITQAVFNQIARYCSVLRPRYIAVSNGLRHFCCRLNESTGSYGFLADIPHWNQIV